MATPGYLYAFEANALQNGATTQMQVTVYDYPDKVIGQVMFFTLGMQFKATVIAHPTFEGDGVWLSGQGVFFPKGKASVAAHFHVHILKTGTIQAEVYDSASGELLWATGTAWPALESVPIRLVSLQILPARVG